MPDIFIEFRDGTTKVFKHVGRPGGAYTKNAKTEGSFLVIEDEWGEKTLIPESLIKEVKVNTNNGW